MCLTLAIIWLSVKPIAVPAVVQVSSSQMEALIAKAELSQGTRNFASRLQYRHSAWVSSLETQGFKTAAWLLTWISRLPACSTDCGLASPHNHVSQLLKINLSLDIYTHTHIYILYISHISYISPYIFYLSTICVYIYRDAYFTYVYIKYTSPYMCIHTQTHIL